MQFTASKIIQFTGCKHSLNLDIKRKSGEEIPVNEESDDSKLLAEQGRLHEERYLEKIKASGATVEVLTQDQFSLESAAERTKLAMQSGVDYIYQAAFKDDNWHGYADFLRRVEVPSKLGEYSYEVIDTKLKRSEDPKHVVQLVIYANLICKVQGVYPKFGHLVLGDDTEVSVELAEVKDFATHTINRMQEFIANGEETVPEPCSACSLCKYSDHCKSIWKNEDSLFQVANITKGQIKKIKKAGVTTMKELGEFNGHIANLNDVIGERLITQAKLQTERNNGGEPKYVLKNHVEGMGFDKLPKPQEGDLFYDIEGNPYYRDENGKTGLEYLHGVWYVDGDEGKFLDIWAHSRSMEATALKSLFDFFEQRIEQFPEARIYHYAPYEITALKKMTAEHKYGEDLMDKWLREGRFVDLYKVVYGGLICSEPAYSIKNMEAFYMEARQEDVKSGGASIVAYEEWVNTQDQQILDDIKEYNRVDCVSTLLLRDWLVKIANENGLTTHPNTELRTRDEEAVQSEEDAESETETLLKAIKETANLEPEIKEVFTNLVDFYRREEKPVWWDIFEKSDALSEDLINDIDALAFLRSVGRPQDDKQSTIREYRFDPQETKFRAGEYYYLKNTAPEFKSVKIDKIDTVNGRATLRWGKKNGMLPINADLIPSGPVNTSKLKQSMRKFMRLSCMEEEIPYKAGLDFIKGIKPQFKNGFVLHQPETENLIEYSIAAFENMDNTTMAVQGPPGTGKTYLISHAIEHLTQLGYKVAVASSSHKAIDNVLYAVANVAEEKGNTVGIVKRGGDKISSEYAGRIEQAGTNKKINLDEKHDVVGGTAWCFADDDFAQAYDYLFIDEAGQVSVANILAMAPAAQNIVLVGDQQQLPQVIQGVHPGQADLSCLEYMLKGNKTIPEDMGIFLPISRRMHKNVCNTVSKISYENKLQSDDGANSQSLSDALGIQELKGVFYQPVNHSGNIQTSEEEIEAIKEEIDNLIATTFKDRDGNVKTLDLNDILVVAPYNAQVNLIKQKIEGINVGTVDKFQGQEAPVCLISMTTSSYEDMPRDMDFLFSTNRLNVAISRAKVRAKMFASPKLFEAPINSIHNMKLMNCFNAVTNNRV